MTSVNFVDNAGFFADYYFVKPAMNKTWTLDLLLHMLQRFFVYKTILALSFPPPYLLANHPQGWNCLQALCTAVLRMRIHHVFSSQTKQTHR
jgi:hypothetical protein